MLGSRSAPSGTEGTPSVAPRSGSGTAAFWRNSARRHESINRASPPAVVAATAVAPLAAKNRRRSHPSGARDSPGISIGRRRTRRSAPRRRPSRRARSASRHPLPRRACRRPETAPTTPKAPIPMPPGGCAWASTPGPPRRWPAPPRFRCAAPACRWCRTASIAHSLSHRGERSMTSLPTASIGETTSVIAATSMPMVTASAPAGNPRKCTVGGRRCGPLVGCRPDRRGECVIAQRSPPEGKTDPCTTTRDSGPGHAPTVR